MKHVAAIARVVGSVALGVVFAAIGLAPLIGIASAELPEKSPTFTWDVNVLSGAALVIGKGVPVTISVGAVKAANVRILASSLFEDTTKEPLLSGSICDMNGKCTLTRDIEANTAEQFLLQTNRAPGTYSGSITFASDALPSGKTLASVTIYVSSFSRKLWGVAVIAFGVIAAWLLTTVIRNQLNAKQMLLPVSLLKSTLEGLGQTIAAAGISAPKLQAEIAALESKLTMEKLRDNGFPPALPVPWSPLPNAATNVYQSYVQDIGTWVTDLTLITDGLTKAQAFAVPGNPANQQQVAACVAQIDLLANTVIAPNPQELGPKIDTLLIGLQQQLAGAKLALQALDGTQVSLPTPAQLEVSIDRFSLLAWAWILVVTIAVGAYVLIFSAKGLGFGTPADYLLCFFWGVGLPSGASLITSTTSTVSTTFGVAR
jgi:hypothetical protein